MMSDDQSKIYNSLRASTIALLGYDDVDPLSAAQEIRISRAISLRLIVDSAQAKQLRGEVIDVKAFVDASEDLERMVGGNPASPPVQARFGPSARERLKALIEKTVSSDAYERGLAQDPVKARAEFEERLQEAIAKFGLKPAGSDAQRDSDVPHPPPSPSAPAGGGLSAPVEPAPQRPMTVEEKMDRVNAIRPPAHYLRDGQPREDWRDHIDADGNIISPWVRPHG